MITEAGKAANALGGKTARACDSCLKKRARWFCAADDAFLCQSCDTFVHSANQLASRHERVRLETSSSSSRAAAADNEKVAPKWHQGFTRKARTPRNTKPPSKPANSHHLVPAISGDDEEDSRDETEEQILCRVPVFNPELCSEMVDDPDFDNIIPHEFIASDAELAEFAADVESLLGTGFDDDVYGVVNELGNHYHCAVEDKRVKMEANEEDQDGEEVQAVIACHFDPALDMAREAFNWDFPYLSSSPLLREEEEVKVTNDISDASKDDFHESKEERTMMFLKLNYETVITAWDSQGSPWADGTKPEFNPNDCWPDFMSTSPRNLHHPFEVGSGRIGGGGRDEEREAKVLRYKEKRRTRLFSKKIRYEVRKLNAEKRPRMKGRFVKRSSCTSFAGPSRAFP